MSMSGLFIAVLVVGGFVGLVALLVFLLGGPS